jgi:hypothetical protein
MQGWETGTRNLKLLTYSLRLLLCTQLFNNISQQRDIAFVNKKMHMGSHGTTLHIENSNTCIQDLGMVGCLGVSKMAYC